MNANVRTATMPPTGRDFRLNCLRLKPMSEKVSLEYFKTSHVKNNIGILYPKKGMSSACGKKIIAHMAITLRIGLNIFMFN